MLGPHLLVSQLLALGRVGKLAEVSTTLPGGTSLLHTRNQLTLKKHTGLESSHAGHSVMFTTASEVPWLHIISDTTQDLSTLTLVWQLRTPHGKQPSSRHSCFSADLPLLPGLSAVTLSETLFISLFAEEKAAFSG